MSPRSITCMPSSAPAVPLWRRCARVFERPQLRLARPTAAEDLERLRKLPARETHLALVKERYTNIRANVWFHGLDARSRGRVMVSAELPLLYPLGRSKELPEIRYPSVEEGTPLEARQRSGKLEPEPFLESLPVHRYRPTLDRRRR